MPLLTGSLSDPARRLTSGYDRESRRLKRKGFDRAAEALAIEGSKERLKNGSIASAEKETVSDFEQRANEQLAVRTRAKQEFDAMKKAAPEPAAASVAAAKLESRIPNATPAAKPESVKTVSAKAESGSGIRDSGNAEPVSRYADYFERSAKAAEPPQTQTDKEGRSILQDKYDELMDKNVAESERLKAEGAKADLTNSILTGGTAALIAATERVKAKYGPDKAAPKPSATSGLEGTIADIGEARSKIADELKQSRPAVAATAPPAVEIATPNPPATPTLELPAKPAAKPAAAAPTKKRDDQLTYEERVARRNKDFETFKPTIDRLLSGIRLPSLPSLLPSEEDAKEMQRKVQESRRKSR